MHRIDHATADVTTPGKPKFTEGNPGTGKPATVVTDDWLNDVQENIMDVIEDSGVVPTKGDAENLKDAISAMIAAAVAEQILGGLADVTITDPVSGHSLIHDGTGWVNGTPTAAQNDKLLLLNSLLDTIRSGSAARLINAYPNPFTDLAGIDTGASSAYQHDAVKSCIHNAGTVTVVSSSSSQWGDGNASFSWTGDDIAASATLKSMRLAVTFAADFSVTFTVASSEGYIGVYDASEDAAFNASVGSSSNFDAMTKSWWIGPPVSAKNGVWYATTEVVASSPAHGTEMRLERVGDTFYLYAGGSLYHTWAQTFSGAVRLMVSASSSASFQNVSWTIPGGATNMVVLSNSLTALSAPAAAHCIALVEPVDAVVYGTDFKMFASNDDGVTMDELAVEQLATTTITVEGAPLTVDVVYGTGDLTGTASTSCRYRLNSYNTKEQRVYGAAPEFR